MAHARPRPRLPAPHPAVLVSCPPVARFPLGSTKATKLYKAQCIIRQDCCLRGLRALLSEVDSRAELCDDLPLSLFRGPYYQPHLIGEGSGAFTPPSATKH